jgi:hypothetical protein
MGLLRRLLGGGSPDDADARDGGPSAAGTGQPAPVDEAARDRELLLADAARLNDELLQRQLRYADRSWTPPAQGGTRRSDDEAEPGG